MFDYPGPRSEITAWTICVHLALLLAASTPIFFLFWKSRKNAQVFDLVLLGLTSLTALCVLLVIATSVHSSIRPFIFGYLLYFESITIVTMFVVARQLTRQCKKPAVMYVLASLFALGLLIGVLLPSVPSAREAARRMQCSNQLKNLMLGIHHQAESQENFLPRPFISTESGERVSWRVELLPFIEHKELYAQYDRHAPWDAPTNLLLAKDPTPPIYRCPSNIWDQDDRGCFYSAYAMIFGSWAVDGSGATRSMSDAYNQQRDSLVIVEACGQNIVWTDPRDTWLNKETTGVNLPGKQKRSSPAILSSHHPGGAYAASIDGSVNFISADIDRELLRQLCVGEYQVR